MLGIAKQQQASATMDMPSWRRAEVRLRLPVREEIACCRERSCGGKGGAKVVGLSVRGGLSEVVGACVVLCAVVGAAVRLRLTLAVGAEVTCVGWYGGGNVLACVRRWLQLDPRCRGIKAPIWSKKSCCRYRLRDRRLLLLPLLLSCDDAGWDMRWGRWHGSTAVGAWVPRIAWATRIAACTASSSTIVTTIRSGCDKSDEARKSESGEGICRSGVGVVSV